MYFFQLRTTDDWKYIVWPCEVRERVECHVTSVVHILNSWLGNTFQEVSISCRRSTNVKWATSGETLFPSWQPAPVTS